MNFEVQFLLCMLSMIERAMNLGKDLLRSDTPEEIEHIKKEDEILYRWMDRQLTDTEIGKLYSAFNDVDRQFGGTPKKYEDFVNRIEKVYQS